VSVASAATSVVDADSFASGTNISSSFPGVTLTAVFGEPSSPTSTGPVYAVAEGLAPTAPNVFAWATNDTAWGNGTFEFLRADFAVPTTSVSLVFAADDSSDGNAELVAFNAGGAEIGRAQQLSTIALGSPQTLTVTAPDISYVVAYWDEINRDANGILDRLEFQVADAVPATTPLTALLLAACLGGLGVFAIAQKQGLVG